MRGLNDLVRSAPEQRSHACEVPLSAAFDLLVLAEFATIMILLAVRAFEIQD
jgi:hypothetical protein